MSDCIFCKIIRGEIPAKKVYETDNILVIHDIAPKAPVHYLVIPKKHLADLRGLTEQDRDLAYEMLTIPQILCKNDASIGGFNYVANNGSDAGQSVFHLHWHFLAGKSLWHGLL